MCAPALVQGPNGCAWMVLYLIICNSLGSPALPFLGYWGSKKNRGNFVSVLLSWAAALRACTVCVAFEACRATWGSVCSSSKPLLPVDSVCADAGPFLTTFCTNEITFKCSLFAPFYKMVVLSRTLKVQTFFRSSVAQVMFSASFAVCWTGWLASLIDCRQESVSAFVLVPLVVLNVFLRVILSSVLFTSGVVPVMQNVSLAWIFWRSLYAYPGQMCRLPVFKLFITPLFFWTWFGTSLAVPRCPGKYFALVWIFNSSTERLRVLLFLGVFIRSIIAL